MIDSLIIFLQTYLLPLGGLGVFLASVTEEVIAPVPSVVIIFASGFLLLSGPVDFYSLFRLVTVVVIPSALGTTIGSLFVYAIAFFSGKTVLLKWGKWLGLSWEQVLKIQEKFSKSRFDEISLVLARATPVIPSVAISAFCGLFRVPLGSYILYTFIGIFIRSAVLGFFGWRVGELYFRYAYALSTMETAIFWSVVILVGLFVVWNIYRLKTKFRRKNPNHEPVL